MGAYCIQIDRAIFTAPAIRKSNRNLHNYIEASQDRLPNEVSNEDEREETKLLVSYECYADGETTDRVT